MIWNYNMDSLNYCVEISVNESEKIEESCEHVRTIFYGEDTIYKIFYMKDGNKIELKYEYFYEEGKKQCVIHKTYLFP